MSDVFISHVEEDSEVALDIARGLEASGYTAWSYERDSYPGLDYLDQVERAIEDSQAVVVLISPEALGSQQVEDEVKWAREQRKPFVPILKGISWSEFQNRRPRWRMALGIAAAVSVPPEGIGPIIPRLVRGLEGLGVKPRTAQKTEDESHAALGSPDVNLTSEPKAKLKPRVLEAAAPKQALPGRATEVVATVRLLDSEGLKSAIDGEQIAGPTREEIRAKPFELEFPFYAGTIGAAEVALRLDSPDFEPASQIKKLRVPPDKDSDVCTFLVAPKVAGELLLNLELFKGEDLVASRTIRTRAEVAEAAIGTAKTVLSIPLIVVVRQDDSSAVGATAILAVRAGGQAGPMDTPSSESQTSGATRSFGLPVPGSPPPAPASPAPKMEPAQSAPPTASGPPPPRARRLQRVGSAIEIEPSSPMEANLKAVGGEAADIELRSDRPSKRVVALSAVLAAALLVATASVWQLRRRKPPTSPATPEISPKIPNREAAQHVDRGNALMRDHDWDGAIAEYREAIRLRPDYAQAHLELGLALAGKGDSDGAIAEYREAIRVEPDYGQAHYILGNALGARGDWDGEISEEREAIRLKPDDGRPHLSLGRALERKGMPDKALDEYRKARDLDPRNPVFLGNYERLAKKLGRQ
jgi:Flp pilus assembly protein TadD